MRLLSVLLVMTVTNFLSAQVAVYHFSDFEKVVISPHIEAVFVEGDQPSVEVISCTEPISKLNVKQKNNELRIYLDGAKVATKTKRKSKDNWVYRESIYKGTVAKVKITYNTLNNCDIRGSEAFLFTSPIHQNKLRLEVYGASKLSFSEVDVTDLKMLLYGESEIEIKSGKARNQKIVGYGDSSVDLIQLKTLNTKITTYGEGDYFVHAQDQLYITSFGSSTIQYAGNPVINQSVTIGETELIRNRN